MALYVAQRPPRGHVLKTEWRTNVTTPSRMPRYDVRNDGAGPYAAFYCDKCDREYRSQPDVGATIAKDVGRSAVGGFLRRIPLVGDAVADNVVGELEALTE